MSSFLVGFCVLCAAVSAIKTLLPDSQMKQIISFFCAVTFIVCLITNITKSDFNIDAFFNMEVNEEYISDEIHTAALKPIIAAVLQDGGVPYKKIEVQADKTENGSIVINKVIIVTQEEYLKKAEELVKANTDIENLEVVSD